MNEIQTHNLCRIANDGSNSNPSYDSVRRHCTVYEMIKVNQIKMR